MKALQLDEKKFHLVGCSMGGHIAGIYASLHPENLLSLCMVCPHGIEHKSHDKMIEEGKANGKFVLLPQTTAELREMFNRLTHKKIEFPDIILSGILQLRLEKNVYYRQCKILSHLLLLVIFGHYLELSLISKIYLLNELK